MNLNFIILYVRDIQKLTAFYRDVVGMTVLDAISGPNFTTLKPESGAMIGLQDAQASKLPPGQEQGSGSVELSFEVEDVDASYAQWQARGVELLSEVLDLPFGRYFLAKDPEGRFLSIYRFRHEDAALKT